MAGEAGASASSGDLAAATNRVLERLHAPLMHWLGRDGSHAILARALDRARVRHPSLANVTITPSALDRPASLGGLGDQQPSATRAALIDVIATLLGILNRLVGADLLMRLLLQAWPDGRFDSASPPAEPEAPAPPSRESAHPTRPMPLTKIREVHRDD